MHLGVEAFDTRRPFVVRFVGAFALVLTFLSSSSGLASTKVKRCPVVVNEVTSDSETRAKWEPTNFTDPATHNPGHFRYIVHTVDRAARHYALDGVYDHLVSSVLENSNAAFSASVIDQGHTGTFGRIGFILKVPAPNILAVKPSDMGSFLYTDLNGKDKADIEAWALRFPVVSPAQLLSRTSDVAYNEILVRGEQIEIVGIIKKQISDGEAIEIKDLSVKHRLPVIDLPWP